MTDHSLDSLVDNILWRASRAVFWSPMWSACAALLIWLSFSFAVNANYEVVYATILTTLTGGIWLIQLGIHILIRFFAERYKKTLDVKTISLLKRTARLVLLLPWGSFLLFFVAAFVGRIYWLDGDISRLFADVDGWAFSLVLVFTALIHLAMLVLVYCTCYSTLRLYFLIKKEHCRLGFPSGCIDTVILGFLVLGIGILLYYAISFYDSRNVELTQPKFHALAFLDQQSILGITFDNGLSIFDTSTPKTVTLMPKTISERHGSSVNGIPVNFYVRPRLVDKNRTVVALQDDYLTLTRINLMPGAEPRKIVYEERLTMFDVDSDGEWSLAMHETGRVSLTRFSVTENEKPSIHWIDAPLARLEKWEKTNYESAYSIPFDLVFLLPPKNDSDQPDITVVLKEGIYTVRTAPDYHETVRTDLSFPGDNDNTFCRTFVSPNSKYVLLSFGRWGSQPQHKSVLLECETGERLIEFPPLFVTDYYSGFAFSPDSQMLITLSQNPHRDGNAKACVWNIAEKEMRGQPISVLRDVQNVSFSPDGRFVVSPVGGKIHFWSFPQWKHRYSIPLPKMYGAGIGFSPDGTRIFANQYGGFSVLKTNIK